MLSQKLSSATVQKSQNRRDKGSAAPRSSHFRLLAGADKVLYALAHDQVRAHRCNLLCDASIRSGAFRSCLETSRRQAALFIERTPWRQYQEDSLWHFPIYQPVIPN
ncbi:hypothetical protein, partial [Mesorhizobium sp. M0074]|uniref:hypothetical protein n=1 Tax=unclassified Mesorhizobium TaxID=325217 RepID=UPI00333D15C8